MTSDELKERLASFAADILAFSATLRRSPDAKSIADQLSRSGPSISANYRSACRARSRREFIARLGIALDEADETVGWLDLVVRANQSGAKNLPKLRREAEEILAILAASRRTAQRNPNLK